MFGDKGNDNFTGGLGADSFEFVSSEMTQADTIQDYISEDQLKFYLTADASVLTDGDIVKGNISRGNVTTDLTCVELASLDDLTIVYGII